MKRSRSTETFARSQTQVTPEDFHFQGLASAAATANSTIGSVVNGANVEKLQGLNTLRLSMSRIHYAPNGLNPTSSSKVKLYVGFVTTAGKLFAKYINKVDIFVFPKGLHFQNNTARTPASVIAAFNSQLPRTQSIMPSLFGALPDNILVETFQMKPTQVKRIKSRFSPKK